MSEHVLSASGIVLRQRRRVLLPPTDLEVRSGQVLAVVGEPGHGHTALALALAGRVTLTEGWVELDGSRDDAVRRHAVALVDVPGVSEPDDLVPIGAILGEELAMAGHPARRRSVQAWAPDTDLAQRTEDVAPAERVALLLRAAALRPRLHFVVLTMPDRWGVRPETWEPLAAELAEQGLGVVVTVAEPSRELLSVPVTTIGGAA